MFEIEIKHYITVKNLYLKSQKFIHYVNNDFPNTLLAAEMR